MPQRPPVVWFSSSSNPGGTMSISIKRSEIVLAALIGSLVSVALGQDLMKNRGFESGAEPGDATVLAPGNKAIDGWTVVDGEIAYVGKKWKPAEGARSVS